MADADLDEVSSDSNTVHQVPSENNNVQIRKARLAQLQSQSGGGGGGPQGGPPEDQRK